MTPADIVITWPKKRPLQSYLDACEEARANGREINYRVSSLPAFDFGAHRDRPGRVYVVHDGQVHGYHELKYTTWRDDVQGAHDGEDWPPGWYLVRDPEWHPIEPIPMRGFRGWRYFDAGPPNPGGIAGGVMDGTYDTPFG